MLVNIEFHCLLPNGHSILIVFIIYPGILVCLLDIILEVVTHVHFCKLVIHLHFVWVLLIVTILVLIWVIESSLLLLLPQVRRPHVIVSHLAIVHLIALPVVVHCSKVGRTHMHHIISWTVHWRTQLWRNIVTWHKSLLIVHVSLEVQSLLSLIHISVCRVLIIRVLIDLMHILWIERLLIW